MAKAKPLSADAWRTDPDPYRLLRQLRQHHALARVRRGRRKLRLFGCAAARLVWDRLPDDRFRVVVEVAERHADLELRRTDLRTAQTRAAERQQAESVFGVLNDAWQTVLFLFGRADPAWERRQAAADLVRELTAPGFGVVRAVRAGRLAGRLAAVGGGPAIDARLADLVRDLFGDPFRPAEVPAGWRTAAVLGLAKAAHAGRAFDRLPILADALEEAGCDDAEMLVHCRGPGPHARGCWVIDALLGRHVRWG